VTVRYQLSGTTASEISGSVEEGVRDGHLAAGDALPPVRSLASDLGVSPATVAAAYSALRQRGIVETAGRNGTRVRARPALRPTRSALLLPVPRHVVDLSSGHPDSRLLPDPSDALAALARDGVNTGYVSDGVLPEMAAATRAAYARDGIDMSSAGVALAGGALDAIERLLGVHLRAGDRVAVEDPGWSNLLDLIAALGLTTQPMPVDDEGPTVEGLRSALAAGARAVVVTTRAQNPTGASVSPARAEALRMVLGAHPTVLVIEDDHAAQLSVEPLAALAGSTSAWAFVRSVSKPYGPDLRLATVGGDEATIARFVGRQRVGVGWVSTLLQRLILAMWSSPSTTATIDRARASYEARRHAVLAALAARGIEAGGRTGINVWIPVPDETAAVTRLRDAGYAVAPGALYRMTTPPGLRVTVSALDDVNAFADAVAAALTEAPGGHTA
jgi:DNA-binding transcriptional MocR family regulator